MPVANSLLFYEALVRHGVSAELHVFERGRHGLGLGGGNAEFAAWPDLCIAWMHIHGLLSAAE